MTKFEYCNFIQERETKKSTIMYPDESVETISGKTIIKVLNKLGKDEWELVSATFDDQISIYILKREAREN